MSVYHHSRDLYNEIWCIEEYIKEMSEKRIKQRDLARIRVIRDLLMQIENDLNR